MAGALDLRRLSWPGGGRAAVYALAGACVDRRVAVPVRSIDHARPDACASPMPFDQFPKQRPPLTDALAALYADHYRENRSGGSTASSLAQRMERWLHRQVARDLDGLSGDAALTTLELGAGTLNQLAHEPTVGPYDVVEPFAELYRGAADLPRVRSVYADIEDVPDDLRYDRITSVAVLEHICDLPRVVARAGLLLADGGTFRASIPSEGTWLWTLGWRLTTGLEFRLRHGLDYGELMRHEHVNTAAEIEEVLGWFFRSVDCRVFGVHRAVSLYRFLACSNPDLERCHAWLAA